MSPAERELVIAAVKEWVENHADPDEPVLAIGSGRTLSPAGMFHAMATGSATGDLLFQVISEGVRVASLEDVLDGFRTRPLLRKGVGL